MLPRVFTTLRSCPMRATTMLFGPPIAASSSNNSRFGMLSILWLPPLHILLLLLLLLPPLLYPLLNLLLLAKWLPFLLLILLLNEMRKTQGPIPTFLLHLKIHHSI